MINLQELYEWRWLDEDTGLVFPYYTYPFLWALRAWDLSDKTVFEYGMGASSIWWAKKCKKLYGVESNKEWFDAVHEKIGDISELDFTDTAARYVNSIYRYGIQFDIVVVDGIERDDCISKAVDMVKKGGILIVDNWMQPSAFMPTEHSIKLLSKYTRVIWKQPDHYDWQTAIFYIS